MIPRPDYRAHALHIGPAKRAAALWRFVLGLMVAVTGYIALNQWFFQTLSLAMARNDPTFVRRVFDGADPATMYVMLGTFVFMLMPVAVVVVLFHKRSALSLFGPLPLAIRQFAVVLPVLALLAFVLLILPPWDMGGPLTPNLGLGTWLMLLPFSLLAVLIQVSAEEVFFRGYVQQQLAARFRSPLVWMILPSALFALGHYLPEEAGSNATMIAIWAGVFGILMADITARAGSLGPAIALHFYNNFMAIVVVSVPDDLSGLALYHSPFGLGDEAAIRAWLPVDFAHMIVAWLAARLALRR